MAGCATTTKHQVALTGDIMVDGPNAIANGPPRDQVLWQYRMAAAAMRQGKFDLAKQNLDDALLTLGGIYGKDTDAKKARSYFHAEAKKTFIGEPYERSMAYIYRGILYWMDGEPDNARACFRSAEFEDSDAEKHKYAGDWVLPDYLDGLATTQAGRRRLGCLQARPGRRQRASSCRLTIPRPTCCSSSSSAPGRPISPPANTGSNCASTTAPSPVTLGRAEGGRLADSRSRRRTMWLSRPPPAAGA